MSTHSAHHHGLRLWPDSPRQVSVTWSGPGEGPMASAEDRCKRPDSPGERGRQNKQPRMQAGSTEQSGSPGQSVPVWIWIAIRILDPCEVHSTDSLLTSLNRHRSRTSSTSGTRTTVPHGMEPCHRGQGHHPLCPRSGDHGAPTLPFSSHACILNRPYRYRYHA